MISLTGHLTSYGSPLHQNINICSKFNHNPYFMYMCQLNGPITAVIDYLQVLHDFL